MLTSCSHLYCAECLRDISYEASEMNQDHSRCLKCNEAFTGSFSCSGLKELDPINISSPPQKSRPQQQRGLLKENLPERPKRTINETMTWVIMDDDIVPSTKTAAVTEQVEQWLQDFPTEKIIIFSQFHLMYALVAESCLGFIILTLRKIPDLGKSL